MQCGRQDPPPGLKRPLQSWAILVKVSIRELTDDLDPDEALMKSVVMTTLAIQPRHMLEARLDIDNRSVMLHRAPLLMLTCLIGNTHPVLADAWSGEISQDNHRKAQKSQAARTHANERVGNRPCRVRDDDAHNWR